MEEFKYFPDCESVKPGPESVNKEATCFFCLHNNYQSHDGNILPPSINEEKVSLFRICRYLKIDCNNIILVSLCPECKTIVENLSNLLEQLEVLKMKVDNKLGQFRKLIPDSDGNKQFCDNFRAQIIDKCNKQLNCILPAVIIEDIRDKPKPAMAAPKVKLPTSHITSPTIPASTYFSKIAPLPPPEILKKVNKWKCTSCPSTFIHKRHFQAHRRNIHAEKIAYTCPRCNSKFDKRSDFLQHKNFDCPRLPPGISKNNPPPGLRKCDICKQSKIVSENFWTRHNIRFHVETHFTTLKLPNLSPENFKIYCDQVLNIQQQSAKKVRNSDNVIMIECPNCSKTLTDQFSLRCHLFNSHKDILSKLIIATQQQITLEEISDTSNPPIISLPKFQKRDKSPTAKFDQDDSREEYFTCKLCQPHQQFKSCSKSRHNANFHPEILFSSVRSPKISEQDFKGYCEHMFNVEIKSFKRVPYGKSVHKRFQIECGFCLKKFCDRTYIRNHLTIAHKSILKDKLKKLQNIKGLGKTKNVKIRLDLKKIPKEKYDPRWRKCKECGRMLSNEYNLKRHMKRVHKVDDKQVDAKATRKETGDPNESFEITEIVQDKFEQSDLFVTKVDVSNFQQIGVNVEEIDVEDSEDFKFEEEHVIDNDNQEEDFEMKIVPDKELTEI